MNEKDAEVSLWRLAEEVARCSKKADSARRASMTGGFLQRWRHRKGPDSYETRIDDIAEEVIARFEGVIHAIYEEVATSVGSAAVVPKFQTFMNEIWARAADDLVAGNAAERISCVLWFETERECGAFAATKDWSRAIRFKPKLMLRQFVDELPESPERKQLAKAYAFRQRSNEEIEDMADAYVAAYSRLHQVVVRHSARLEQLTDGAISTEIFRAGVALDRVYDQWIALAR